ncbi:MAG: hypothetical protein CL583_01920 [Alteromonadaceae bacterium]|nr:hypothetical protein [Alteromonadaceae bacterium]|tara:strand:+ start:3657 stop:3866 length:210 start_codon:yes stop_codon:yes gene_type:complete
MTAAQKLRFESRLNEEARQEELNDRLKAAYDEGYRDRGYHKNSYMPVIVHQAKCWDESETRARIERGEV